MAKVKIVDVTDDGTIYLAIMVDGKSCLVPISKADCDALRQAGIQFE